MPPVFEQDHFSVHIPVWTELLSGFVGEPVNALEVGSFEGRSATWLLENVLTHENSHITCVDPFGDFLGISGDVLYSRFKENISQHRSRVTVVRGLSQAVLRYLPVDTYGLIYIDGDHSSASVMTDAVLAWSLLKVDGIMIFDDYGTEADGVNKAVKFFYTCFQDEIEVLRCAWQLCIRKVLPQPKPWDLEEPKVVLKSSQ